MKNAFLTACICLALNGLSQQDQAWSFGLQWGFQGNHSQFSGGTETANARFQHNPYGSGALDFLVRFDHDAHWMFMGGLGFSSYGFEYALSQNYSLRSGHEEGRYSAIRSDFSAVTLPLMVYYKFNPDCKNKKWVIGAGFAHAFTDDGTVSASYVEGTEGNYNGNYLSSESVGKENMSTMLRFSVGREKLFKRGSILNVSMLFNVGTKTLANSSVTYEIDGINYHHEFSNKGNFIGFRMAYFFKPFGTHAIAK